MIDLRREKLRPIPKAYRSNILEGVLIDEKTIRKQVNVLARQINKEKKKWHCIVVLNGALVFASDLMRKLKLCTYDTIQLGSYVGQHSSKKPKIMKPLSTPIKGRDVLIVEDIVDMGYTIQFLVRHCKKLGAKSVKVAGLLSKPSRREVNVKIDYLGFVVPNRFVVGYGIDCDEQFRNLPFVAVVKPL